MEPLIPEDRPIPWFQKIQWDRWLAGLACLYPGAILLVISQLVLLGKTEDPDGWHQELQLLGFSFFAGANWIVALYFFLWGGWLASMGWGLLRRYRYAWWMFMVGSAAYLVLVGMRTLSAPGIGYAAALLAWGWWRAPVFGVRRIGWPSGRRAARRSETEDGEHVEGSAGPPDARGGEP